MKTVENRPKSGGGGGNNQKKDTHIYTSGTLSRWKAWGARALSWGKNALSKSWALVMLVLLVAFGQYLAALGFLVLFLILILVGMWLNGSLRMYADHIDIAIMGRPRRLMSPEERAAWRKKKKVFKWNS